MSDLEEDIGLFLACVDALAERLTPARRARDADAPECSPRELRALRALGRGGPVTMTALAKLLEVPLSTATRIVERLSAKGLVERKQSTRDRRIVEVRFGRRGQQINRYVERSRRAEAQALLSRLPERERARLLRQLARLLDTAPSSRASAPTPSN